MSADNSNFSQADLQARNKELEKRGWISIKPSLEDYTTLEDHQSQTPDSFFRAPKPVLHLHTRARVLISTDSEGPEGPEYMDMDVHDVYVGSENLTLFRSEGESQSIGLKLLYPTISLHAISSFPGNDVVPLAQKALYMQVEKSDSDSASDGEEAGSREIWLIPASEKDDVPALYTAISNCSDLNPDPKLGPDDYDKVLSCNGDRLHIDEFSRLSGISGLPGVLGGAVDGGLPPPFPGSGGWITADNVDEFFDAEGNFIGGGEQEGNQTGAGQDVLGEGAGRVRLRDEMEVGGEATEHANGHGEDEGNKWQRTN